MGRDGGGLDQGSQRGDVLVMAVPVAALALPDAGQDGVAGIDVAQDHDLLLREVEAGQGAPAQG